MEFDLSGPRLFWGLLGGFLATYLLYYIFGFLIAKFTTWEQQKSFRASLVVTAVLLFAVAEFSWVEKIIFYTPPLANILLMEYLVANRKYCPKCTGKNKRDATACVHCGKSFDPR